MRHFTRPKRFSTSSPRRSDWQSMARFETQVGIVGAGPAGLMLSHLLHLRGIHSIVLEAKPRAYCEERVRAGVLEHTSVQILRESGVGERLEREGLRRWRRPPLRMRRRVARKHRY